MKNQISNLFFNFLSKCSIKASHRISYFLGTIIYFLPTRENKVTKANINKVFADKSKKFRKNLIKKSLIESSKSILESVPIWQLNKDQLNKILNVKGAENIPENKPVIFVTLHFASWELTNLWLSMNYSLSSLYRMPKIKNMDNVIKKARQKFGTEMLADNLQSVIILKKDLDNKQKVLIAPDQDPVNKGSVIVDFFKIPVRTSTLVIKLAQKTKAEILFIYTIRKQQKFDLNITKAPEAIYCDDVKKACLCLNQEIEKIIKKSPEQYSWSYKRFRYQEDGQDIYK